MNDAGEKQDKTKPKKKKRMNRERVYGEWNSIQQFIYYNPSKIWEEVAEVLKSRIIKINYIKNNNNNKKSV